MTFTQTALALVQEHAALTHELDRLSRAQDEIPSLETALAYLRNAMPSAEDRIIKGRAKLRQEWSSHLFEVQGRASTLVTIGSRVGSAKMKAKEADERVKLDQQESIYQEAMQRWEDEEKDLDEMKRQYREALRKLYERRDMLEPCERLFSHLDRLYEQLFGSLKLEYPQDERLKWQISCAVDTESAIRGRLEAEMETLRFLNTAFSDLRKVDNRLQSAMEQMLLYPKWASVRGSANFESVSIHLSLARAYIKRITEALGKAQEQRSSASGSSPEIRQPTIYMMPVQETSTPCARDGITTVFVAPRTPFTDEEQTEMMQRSLRSVHHGMILLEIECESAQRRVDRLLADTSNAQEILSTGRAEQRALRRAIFEEVVGKQEQGSESSSQATFPRHDQSREPGVSSVVLSKRPQRALPEVPGSQDRIGHLNAPPKVTTHDVVSTLVALTDRAKPHEEPPAYSPRGR